MKDTNKAKAKHLWSFVEYAKRTKCYERDEIKKRLGKKIWKYISKPENRED